MKKSAYYSDLIFTFAFLGFCALFLLRYFKIPLIFSLILSVSFGLAGSYLLSLYLKKKRELFALKKSEEDEKESLCFYLKLATEEEIINFFKPILPFLLSLLNAPNTTNEYAQKKDENNLSKLFLQGYAFFPIFKFNEITCDDIARFYPKLKQEPAPVLLFDKATLEAQSLIEKLGILNIDGNKLYKALKSNDSIPKEYPIKTAMPVKRKKRNIAFAKSNSKRFFSGGAMILASSVFIPYPAYYVISGCLLLLTSVFVRIFGYR
ncbi:MAG: hypothetical protein E7343_00805 [Clostridiales bacterium]|nr:hypothetical protein [Clostridiales bacterium]